MIKVYIAHPLEARDAPEGSPWADMEANVERYLRFCAAFTNAGFTVVSWVHHYMMHTRGLTPPAGTPALDHAAFYLERDADLIRASDVLVVAGPPEVSSGLRYEIDVAKTAGVEVLMWSTWEPWAFDDTPEILAAVREGLEIKHPLDWPAAVVAEVARGRAKFPSPDHLTLALGEEVGEVQRAVLHHRYEGGSIEDVRKELVQVMCVAVRLLEEGDPTVSLPPCGGAL